MGSERRISLANTDKNRKKRKRAQRTVLCITTTAYRTVSHAALCLLTGNLPIYIKIKMLGETYEWNKIHKTRIGADDGNELKEELEAQGNKYRVRCYLPKRRWTSIITPCSC